MDPLLDARLTAIEKQLTETNVLVRKIRRSSQIASYTRMAYWVLVILLAFGSFYFIQPYLGQLGAAYGICGGTGNGDTNTASSLLEQLKGYKQGLQDSTQ